MGLNVDVNISGMNELDEAMANVDEKYIELSKAVNALRTAVCNLGIEINQPSAGTDG